MSFIFLLGICNLLVVTSLTTLAVLAFRFME